MSTALYRRYRPDSFADVIGQEHVTDPLMAALRGGRVTHAYLFSGPRGCGKTTSARIFARCLNCANGPTDTPCGICDSCVELARGGTGSLDVVELDAASHGGVDDARELRERAAFAPARDRYKIFIIDEAHMVTPQGFNALLKLVEEPPEHVKFVFATTEPEKVIGTIRSRTHHYPFRLVPPERLLSYLGELATAEQVSIDPGVLQLVVRAGGGSVRDSLSVLDQLIAGADDGAVAYERAVALLGFTHATLLDDAADALAARDGASMFRIVDRVISTGHAPRRFVEDLLERLRDLIVVLAAGEQAGSVLRGIPEDQLERMRAQAKHLGLANASRAADLTNLALTEMVGATSPRLQLELLCARLLLPAADDGRDGFAARIERLESGQPATGASLNSQPSEPRSAPAGHTTATPTPDIRAPEPRQVEQVRAESVRPEPKPEPAPALSREPAPERAAAEPAAAPTTQSPGTGAPAEAPQAARSVPEPATAQTRAATATQRSAGAPAGAPPAAPAVASPAVEESAPSAAAAAPPAAAQTSDGMTAEQVRQRWPEVMSTLGQIRRITWALAQNAQVVELGGGILKIGFPSDGLVSTFRSGSHAEPLQKALAETIGLKARVEAVVEGASAPASAPAAPVIDRAAEAAADWARPARTAPAQTTPARDSEPRDQQRAGSREPAPRETQRPQQTSATAPAAEQPEPGQSRAPRAASESSSSATPTSASRTSAPSTWEPAGSEPPITEPPDDGPEPPEDFRPSERPAQQAQQVQPSSQRRPPWEEDRENEPAPSGNEEAAAPPTATQRLSDAASRMAAAGPGSSFADDEPDASDPDLEDSGLVGAPLVARMLGGTVIDEFNHEERA